MACVATSTVANVLNTIHLLMCWKMLVKLLMYSINMNTDPIKEVNDMDCHQITIVDNKIVCNGIHDYTQGDLDCLVRDGWEEIHNGVMSDDGVIFTIIRKCE